MRSVLHSVTRHTVKRVGSSGTPSPSDAEPGAAGAPLPEQAPETALKETLACAAQVAGTEQDLHVGKILHGIFCSKLT